MLHFLGNCFFIAVQEQKQVCRGVKQKVVLSLKNQSFIGILSPRSKGTEEHVFIHTLSQMDHHRKKTRGKDCLSVTF